jgi:peptide deformylase
MASQTILQLGNPVLWQRSKLIEDPSDSSTAQTIRDLSDTLAGFRERTGFGRGIAAPQIGILGRVIFIRMHPAGFAGPLINPEVVDHSGDSMELWDDCFSFPDLMVRVKRAARIRVEYTDEHSVRKSLEAEGDLSELLQHEIDHLDGVLAVQRAISPQAFCSRIEWEARYR